ncbi:chemotaxis protein CheW [Marinifaba aquimaris]|uniref:chemotaxis protein CheW n=1 Tax=Marinifaba aquimaris TaxID=2741323 RepID=UPI0031B5FF55
MDKHLFASEKVMEDYLSELLTEDATETVAEVESPDVVIDKAPAASRAKAQASIEQVEAKPQFVAKPKPQLLPLATKEREEEADTDLKPVAKLLEKVNLLTSEQQAEKVEARVEPVSEPIIEAEPIPVAEVITAEPVVAEEVNTADIAGVPPAKTAEESYREGNFQALFFSVAGLTVAVPLTELGGIHNLDKTNSLFGKPEWFIGVMVHREEKLNVVDTALWVMPEKYDEQLKEELDYKYLIMLGESQWGLACEKLVNTVTLTQDDVKWRERAGKRPWLAGLVKEKMCALLNVNQLIDLLEQGLGS